jgi:16S rRNA (uracil1498-N3)-methyltransferase
MVKKAMAYELALLPWELETAISLKHILSSRQPKHILLLIGPEGGLSKQEAETAMASGFISVSLGPRILRTETAGMAALSMIHYAYHL